MYRLEHCFFFLSLSLSFVSSPRYLIEPHYTPSKNTRKLRPTSSKANLAVKIDRRVPFQRVLNIPLRGFTKKRKKKTVSTSSRENFRYQQHRQIINVARHSFFSSFFFFFLLVSFSLFAEIAARTRIPATNDGLHCVCVCSHERRTIPLCVVCAREPPFFSDFSACTCVSV